MIKSVTRVITYTYDDERDKEGSLTDAFPEFDAEAFVDELMKSEETNLGYVLRNLASTLDHTWLVYLASEGVLKVLEDKVSRDQKKGYYTFLIDKLGNAIKGGIDDE